jgi:hypothetical protein
MTIGDQLTSLKDKLALLEEMVTKCLDSLEEAVVANRKLINPAFNRKPRSSWSK